MPSMSATVLVAFAWIAGMPNASSAGKSQNRSTSGNGIHSACEKRGSEERENFRQRHQLFLPAAGIRRVDADLVENAPDHRVGEFLEGLRAAVERRGCWQDDGSGLHYAHDIARVDEIPRRLARGEDQLPLLLKKDIGGAKDQ